LYIVLLAFIQEQERASRELVESPHVQIELIERVLIQFHDWCCFSVYVAYVLVNVCFLVCICFEYVVQVISGF
jgi:hypothetical protein